MKLIFILAMLGAATLQAGDFLCETVEKDFPLYSCFFNLDPPGKTFHGWMRRRLDPPIFETGLGLILAKNVTDPAVREKVNLGFARQKEIGGVTSAKVKSSKEVDGLLVFVYDSPMITSFKQASDYSMGKSDQVNANSMIAVLADGLSLLHKKGYIGTGIDEDGIFFEAFLKKDLSIFMFYLEELSKFGAPFEDIDNFRYWDPSRLDPQAKIDGGYQPADDAYRIGVLFCWLYNKQVFPFKGETKEEYAVNALKGDYEITGEIPVEQVYLISRLMAQDRKARLDIDALRSLILDVPLSTGSSPLIRVPLNSRSLFPKEWMAKLSPKFVSQLALLDKQGLGDDGFLTQKQMLIIGGSALGLIVAVLILWLSLKGKKHADEPTTALVSDEAAANEQSETKIKIDAGETV